MFQYFSVIGGHVIQQVSQEKQNKKEPGKIRIGGLYPTLNVH
jgi:hypothetical protein